MKATAEQVDYTAGARSFTRPPCCCPAVSLVDRVLSCAYTSPCLSLQSPRPRAADCACIQRNLTCRPCWSAPAPSPRTSSIRSTSHRTIYKKKKTVRSKTHPMQALVAFFISVCSTWLDMTLHEQGAPVIEARKQRCAVELTTQTPWSQ